MRQYGAQVMRTEKAAVPAGEHLAEVNSVNVDAITQSSVNVPALRHLRTVAMRHCTRNIQPTASLPCHFPIRPSCFAGLEHAGLSALSTFTLSK